MRQYLKDTDIPQEDYAHVTNCLLMSTATPILDEENGTLYFVRRQGAGMVNIGAATCEVTVSTVNSTVYGALQDKEGNPMLYSWNLACENTWTRWAASGPSWEPPPFMRLGTAWLCCSAAAPSIA